MLTQLLGRRASFTSSTLITASPPLLPRPGRPSLAAPPPRSAARAHCSSVSRCSRPVAVDPVRARAGDRQHQVLQGAALRADLGHAQAGGDQAGVDLGRVRVGDSSRSPSRRSTRPSSRRGARSASGVRTMTRPVGPAQLVEVLLQDQPAAVDDPDPGAQLLDLGELVAGQENRGACLVQLGEQVTYLADALRVQAVGRLVEHEQPRLPQQGRREAEPLAHAQRVLLDRAVVDSGQADPLQRLIDPLLAVARAPALSRGVDQREVGAAGQVPVTGRPLDQRADLRQHLGDLGRHRPAHHLDLAAGRVHQAEQHPHHRGLAGPVRPEEAVPVPLAHLQVDPVDGKHPAVALGQRPRDDHGIRSDR